MVMFKANPKADEFTQVAANLIGNIGGRFNEERAVLLEFVEEEIVRSLTRLAAPKDDACVRFANY
ncbi:MAG: hypothetical protein ABSB99_10310 [Acidimicrobiales bacterium]|jgi:hypothetical protein